MYNLLVGFQDGEAPGERVVEYTDEAIKAYIAPGGRVDTGRLLNLPTLVMPEIGSGEKDVARVGHLENLRINGRLYRYRFIPNDAMPAIPSERIQEASASLGIVDFEFRRTHWSVKDVDLYRVLQDGVTTAKPVPSVFRLPVERPRESDLIAVMMPFDPRFAPVYDALSNAAAAVDMHCKRADDIWEEDHIIADVISLIWRSEVVISDFTGKNPNVFYETGIAHSIGRPVIQITQSRGDVPFDLRSIRSLNYLPNGEGLEQLTQQTASRLKDLKARSRT